MKWLQETIDQAFEEMAITDVLMKTPAVNMPEEMIDLTVETNDDWRGWKPIPSIVTDEDLDRLENKIGYELPQSYRYFLKYRHFYELEISDYMVNFPKHLPDNNLTALQEQFLKYYAPEYIIKKGYIYFADFQDFGLLCFDANVQAKNNEYPICFIDHEDLTTVHRYSDNFKEFMTGDSDRGNLFIQQLNDYYSNQ